jgi:hypothetical protein
MQVDTDAPLLPGDTILTDGRIASVMAIAFVRTLYVQRQATV